MTYHPDPIVQTCRYRSSVIMALRSYAITVLKDVFIRRKCPFLRYSATGDWFVTDDIFPTAMQEQYCLQEVLRIASPFEPHHRKKTLENNKREVSESLTLGRSSIKCISSFTSVLFSGVGNVGLTLRSSGAVELLLATERRFENRGVEVGKVTVRESDCMRENKEECVKEIGGRR